MDRRTGMALALLALLAAAVRIHFFTGLQVGDDIVYSRIAVDRLHGKVDVTNVQATRSGFLLPLMASYAAFGAGEGPLVLYNLLCSIGMVGAVFLFARRLWGEMAGVVSGLAAAVHPNLVRFATECHTDTPMALWLVLAFLVFHSALAGDPGARRRVAAGLLVGWAYLHKESAVYAGLFFAGHCAATGRSWKWYLPIALPVLGVVGLEMLGLAALTGNPLERYRLIRYWHSGQYMAERYTSAGEILHRQVVELPVLLFTPWYGGNGTGLVNLACLACGAYLVWRRDAGGKFVGGWFLAFYLAYCFWPSSLFPFMPGFFLFDWTLPVLGAPLVTMAGGPASRLRPLAAGGLALGLVAASLFTLRSGEKDGRALSAGAREAREWIARERPARVISDDKTIESLDFFEGHRPSRVYVPFAQAGDCAAAAVIVDKFWTEQGRWWSRPVPEQVLHPPSSWRKVHETDRIAVYRP